MTPRYTDAQEKKSFISDKTDLIPSLYQGYHPLLLDLPSLVYLLHSEVWQNRLWFVQVLEDKERKSNCRGTEGVELWWF